MDLARKKIGLALGSGAARGFAHLGILKTLEEYGIPLDVIAGTSIGALVGGWYAATKDIDAIISEIGKVDFRSLISWRDISPRTVGAVFSTERLEKFLRRVIGSPRIEGLAIPFAAVATDIRTGEEVELSKGDLVKAILASIAVPAIFPPVEWDGRLLLDGGLVAPVPFQAARNLGADIVIGAALTIDYIIESGKKLDRGFWRPRQLFNIISNSLAVMEHQLIQLQRRPDDILLAPRVSHIHPADFGKLKEGLAAGRSEVKVMKKVIFEKTGIEEKPKTIGEKFKEFLFEE
jgi:NTE family protein